MKPPPTSGRLYSAAGRIGAAALKRWHAARHLRPICGAACRTTGEPCRNTPLVNGRCRFHGGATPRGENWHQPRWVDGRRQDGSTRLDRKLADRERAARRRAERVAAMSADERARHQAWHDARKPGVDRAARRRERDQDRAALKLLSRPRREPPETDEAVELARRIDEARRRVARLEVQIAIRSGRGVFG